MSYSNINRCMQQYNYILLARNHDPYTVDSVVRDAKKVTSFLWFLLLLGVVNYFLSISSSYFNIEHRFYYLQTNVVCNIPTTICSSLLYICVTTLVTNHIYLSLSLKMFNHAWKPIMNRVRPQFLTRFKNIVREIMSGHRFVGECIPTGLEKIKAGSPTNKKAAKRIQTLYLWEKPMLYKPSKLVKTFEKMAANCVLY